MKNIKLYNEDNLDVMKRLPDESIDVICIDPPYLYLKNQKLEREFDEQLFFSECKRVLTKNGFIVMFGRGASFYRWNTILDSLGFTFKEEIVWNKRLISSPVTPISRVHETISLYSKSDGKINKVKLDFIEMNEFNPTKIIETINRIKTAFGNRETFERLTDYFINNTKELFKSVKGRNVTRSSGSCVQYDRTLQFVVTLEEGEREKTIIEIPRDHYGTIHPTQKPVRLIERLLALVIPQDKERKDIIVADWFGGSMSTMEAVHNMGMQGISTEIDEEYFEAGKSRIEKLFENKQEKLEL